MTVERTAGASAYWGGYYWYTPYTTTCSTTTAAAMAPTTKATAAQSTSTAQSPTKQTASPKPGSRIPCRTQNVPLGGEGIVLSSLYRGLSRLAANPGQHDIARAATDVPEHNIPANTPDSVPLDAPPPTPTPPPPQATASTPAQPEKPEPIPKLLLLPEPKDHHLCSVVIVEPDPVIILDPEPAHSVDLPWFKPPTAIRTTRRFARIASVPDPEPELCSESDPTDPGPPMLADTQQATGNTAARGIIRMQAKAAPFRRSQPNSPVAAFTHLSYKGQEKTTLQ